MTLNSSSSNDVIIATSNKTYRGLGGDDTYIITKFVQNNAKINIVDTEGQNTIQLVEGLTIFSTTFASNAVSLELTNGAVITINGTDNFSFDLGGNITKATIAMSVDFPSFADSFGVLNLPEKGILQGKSGIEVSSQNLIEASSDNFSWKLNSPESSGFRSEDVNALMNYLKTPSLSTQAAILIKGNNIIAEYYSDGFDNKSMATSWSVAKSFASTVVGVANDEGYILSVNDPITNYIPQWENTEKDTISLKQLLGMRSGMVDSVVSVYYSSDMVSQSLGRSITNEPGSVFSYSNEDSMLLGHIVENATGMKFQDYADSRLFDPLGINQTWWTDQAGNTLTYAGLDMTPREFARFGLMVAQEGRWQGQQIVSSSWLDMATQTYDDIANYGFQWWTSNTYPFFQALGLDGQYIYVWPDADIVLVRFTFYEHIGEGSTVRVVRGDDNDISYHSTTSGNANGSILASLFNDAGKETQNEEKDSHEIIVPTGKSTYRGLEGNDTYIISKAINSNAVINIVDTEGENTVQLVDGLTISSSKFASNAVSLSLSNGASITISGADKFSFDIGGNATTAIEVIEKDFLSFAKMFGVEDLPESGTLSGSTNQTVLERNLTDSPVSFAEFDIVIVSSDFG
ncbi:uncharacterized protein METZ01_LOCUS128974 [marine metagenome]|uniref:Beta-lactamase-related domain-containing protein n=1 Tax=marine metagenome TaxID=408172 RepID=A0A381YGR0_9ZZZZ|tara:strand:+ start:553 stop:2442 length:1890 start_codon:yes stop_codon:yes gene_type:complete